MPSTKKMWIGTEGRAGKFALAPCPRPGMQRTLMSPSKEILLFEDNSADVANVNMQYHVQYALSLVGTPSDLDGVDFYNQLSAGMWSERPESKIWFADPAIFNLNMMPPAWASPGLMEKGWAGMTLSRPTVYVNVTSSYRQNARSANVPVTGTANIAPTFTNKYPYVLIPIPPGYTLWLGANASVVAGTPVINVETWANGGTTAIATSALTLLGDTSNTRMNASFAGTTAGTAYVRIYLTRTTAVTSTLSVTSMMAQLWPTGMTPVLIGNHIPGQGNLGCKFEDDARVEEYKIISRRGISTRLREVAAA